MKVDTHGGNTKSYEKYYDGKIIDFSSNINPLGYPKGLEEGLIKSMDHMLRYPDIHYRNLKENLSPYMNVDKKNIVVANGATELIDVLIAGFERVILTRPSFAEYELRAQVHGLDISYIDLNEDMSLDTTSLFDQIQEGDLCILTNPHNPSGLSLSKEDLIAIYLHILEKNAYLGLDEAFFEFANLDYDSLDIFKKLDFENVGVIRAATKFFGVPGLRLGYGAFSDHMVEKLQEQMPPWSVNSFAAAGATYLFDKDYIKRSRSFIFSERKRYLSELAKIKGVHPYPSNSNFVLLRIENKSEEDIFYSLLKKGLLIRRCSNFDNLKGTHIRVAIKTEEENNMLIKALKETMEEENGIFI